MIVYNVTCHISSDMEAEWLNWMRAEHLPEVMATGCFLEVKMMRLLTQADDDEGINIAVQYTAQSMADYDRYRDTHAPALQAKTRDKYGERVLAYRSLLEVIG
ncbi:MAG: DUF4286 family protein [Sphingomonadales bacterium]|nr:DUF4286 family protein [Sphingomonadales bacterium]